MKPLTDDEIIEESYQWAVQQEKKLGQYASNEIAWRDICKKCCEKKGQSTAQEIFNDIEKYYWTAVNGDLNPLTLNELKKKWGVE